MSTFIFDCVVAGLLLWFGISYAEILVHNLSAMGIDYMSDWNLFKLLMS